LDRSLHHLILVELLDVEYYRDLETWDRGLLKSLKMVPFQTFGNVSYSPSIVTIAVSSAISEIFSDKEWPDLEIWVWGCSMSLQMVEMAPFDKSCMTFYRSAIVTIPLYHFKLFDRMYERDRHTDRQTDRRTPHDDIGRACIASRGKNGVFRLIY